MAQCSKLSWPVYIEKKKLLTRCFCFFQSDKIYTVIKTSPMWGNVLGKRDAVFKVNQKAHELSVLTMVGPSPDWCIGKHTFVFYITSMWESY